MSDPALRATGLTKTFKVFDRRPGFTGSLRDLVDRRYRRLTAVDHIDLEIGRGEFVGYIGPNGAGKSTTIKMLTGIMQPSSGELLVNGFDPQRERNRYVRTIGAVFGQRTQLWWDLAVAESLELLRRLYDVPREAFADRMRDFQRVLGLEEFIATPVRKLSLGQRMKADLAAALVHMPSVLFLDEPTVGLDVVTKGLLREFLRELVRERGLTVLLTTHDMQDIEALCDRVVVIDHGRIMHDGALAGFKARYAGRKLLHLRLHDAVALEQLHDLPRDGVEWTQPSAVELCAHLDSERIAAGEVLRRVLPTLDVLDVSIEEPSIESVVAELYAGRPG